MLIDHFADIKRILIGYQFHFGIGAPGGAKILDCNSGHSCTLKDISNGCYRISNDKVNLCPQPDRQLQPDEEITGQFITGYKKNVNRRIRTSYRGVRDSLVIKLDDFPISNLSVDNNPIKPISNQSIQLSGIITTQNIGVCSISLWFEGYTPQTEIEWRSICDSALVSFTLSHTDLTRSAWQLNYFVRFLSLKCHKAMNSEINIPATVENDEIIKGWDNFSAYLKKEYEKCDEEPISYNVESYPIVFIHYNLETSALYSMFATPSQVADARLVLNGDLHWKFKTDSVIKDTVIDIDVGTRCSIHWMVAPQGTLKVCSKDLEVETSVEESFTATLLETDLILTMRYFLSAIMQSLSELTKKFDDPVKVADIKDHIFTTMDKYFNIDISQNDQTIRRIETFKDIFHVNDTYKNVTDRLEILSVKTLNENSAVIEQQQIFLAIIFGLFGSLQVLYPFFQKLFENTVISDIWVFFISFTTSAIIAGAIYHIVKKFKYSKKHIFQREFCMVLDYSLSDISANLARRILRRGIQNLETALMKVCGGSDFTYIACPDFSISLRQRRLILGLPIGGYVKWNSTYRFFPIELDVNSCGVHMVKLSKNFNLESFKSALLQLKSDLDNNRIILNGVTLKWNFSRRNHFINIYEDNEGTPFLVAHSSGETVLFDWENLHKMFTVKYVEVNGRNLPYIQGDDVDQYYSIAARENKFFFERHIYLFDRLLGHNNYEITYSNQHFGMIDQGEILMGCSKIPQVQFFHS